jgi:hypothetical protein
MTPGPPSRGVGVGDIWWLPEAETRYPGGKDRYCLIVALETPPGSADPTRAHFVAGSRSSGGRPEVVVVPSEASLGSKTHFRFWWSGSVDLETLRSAGKFKGTLAKSRISEIAVAISASKRVVLKRLINQ